MLACLTPVGPQILLFHQSSSSSSSSESSSSPGLRSSVICFSSGSLVAIDGGTLQKEVHTALSLHNFHSGTKSFERRTVRRQFRDGYE